MNRVIRNAPMAVVLVIAAVAVSSCSKGNAEETVSANEIERATRRTLNIQAEATGQIEPIRVVEVKSKASGEILNLPVETGDVVARGALLAEIDARDVQNSYDQALADRDVARARLNNSVSQLNRVKELRAANVATEQEMESAAFDEANSRSQLVKAETNLLLAEERLKDVTIRAPISGMVIERPVEVGTIIASASQNVSGGTVLMKMADLATMQVRALIDETDLGRIRAGLPVNINVEAYPERTFSGNVLKIEPQAVVEQNVTMFPVLVQLDNSDGLLKVGMNADIQVQIATREDVVVIPNSAIVNTRDAIAAGNVLGISEEDMQAAMRPARPAVATAGELPANASPECTALMQKMRDGGMQGLTEEERTKLGECAGGQGARSAQVAQGGQTGARQGGGQTGGRQGSRGGQRGGIGGPRGGGSQPGQQRTGIVFVSDSTGYQARLLTLGVNDWEYTEVIRGVEEGEQVVIISVARLQQSQQEFLDRIRDRMGGNGPIPGSSPSTRGGGRGGR